MEAWGNNTFGQFGDGSTTSSAVPVDTSPNGIKALSAGAAHSLALLDDDTVRTWGQNTSGQLGDGTTSNRTKPVDIGVQGATAVAGGGQHSLALLDDGTVLAWGGNGDGQLGDGTFTQRTTPVFVANLSGVTVTAVAAGSMHSLALLSDGKVISWGANSVGQLGVGVTGPASPVPVQVTGLDDVTVTAIAAGGLHSLALLDDGTVLAWGRNQNGQLGDFTDIDRPAPVPVAALSDVVAIAAGAQGDHSVALLTDQSVRAWGAGTDGQLGNGALADSPVPDVLQANEVLAIAAGAAHTLCVLVEGGVVACGLNTQGQLGDGTNTPQSSPVAVDGSGVAALAALGLIAAGDAHSLSQ